MTGKNIEAITYKSKKTIYTHTHTHTSHYKIYKQSTAISQPLWPEKSDIIFSYKLEEKKEKFFSEKLIKKKKKKKPPNKKRKK